MRTLLAVLLGTLFVCSTASASTIAAAGDIAGDTPGGGTNAMKTSNMILASNPDHVLALGDLAYTSGTASQFANNYDPSWGRFRNITLPVPGNHEWKTSQASGFGGYWNLEPPYYNAQTIGNWLLLGVDSECSKVGGCSAGSAEYQFVQKQLSSTQANCVLAYWHRPLYNVGNHSSYTAIRPIVQLLVNSHADVILNGHDHNYQRYPQADANGNATTSGVREFVVGTGGAGLYSFQPEPGLQPTKKIKVHGVLNMSLDSGSYSWQFVNTSGVTADAGKTNCH